MSAHTPGPCETLARLALQSERYRLEPEFAAAVDAVLGHPVYDSAPEMLEALRQLKGVAEWARDNGGNRAALDAQIAQARAIIRKATGESSQDPTRYAEYRKNGAGWKED